MAHSALHFSLGMAVASLFCLPSLLRAWRARARLAAPFLKWILLTWALGIYAVIPGILRRLGAAEAVCDGEWMNIFLFYPALNALIPRGTILGIFAIALAFSLQYFILVAAIRRQSQSPPPERNP